jgi:transposase
MTRPYSLDLRDRAVRTVEAGLSRRATAARFAVSVSFVIKLVERWRRHGKLEPDQCGGWKRLALMAHAERVPELVAAEPDLTIAELHSRLAAEGIQASPACAPPPDAHRRRPLASHRPGPRCLLRHRVRQRPRQRRLCSVSSKTALVQ